MKVFPPSKQCSEQEISKVILNFRLLYNLGISFGIIRSSAEQGKRAFIACNFLKPLFTLQTECYFRQNGRVTYFFLLVPDQVRHKLWQEKELNKKKAEQYWSNYFLRPHSRFSNVSESENHQNHKTFESQNRIYTIHNIPRFHIMEWVQSINHFPLNLRPSQLIVINRQWKWY